MGQKVHSKFFRLGISQTHLATWDSTKLNYANTLKNDDLIRNKIYFILNKLFNVSEIHISRVVKSIDKNTYIKILITGHLVDYKLLYKKVHEVFDVNNETIQKNGLKSISLLIQYELRYLIRYLQNLYKANIYISLKFVESPYENAILMAKYIGSKIQKRIPSQRILNNIFKQIKSNFSILGLKIQISGRLNNQELARTEWKRQGTVPLHTLKANIDYAYYPIQTLDGIIGIKIWLYKSK